MRKRFELPFLGSLPISEVEIPTKSRDELPPVLLALKTIYCNADYHRRMFEIIEPVVRRGKSQKGREGMTVWEVIVLSVVRLTLNTNYDRLQWVANSDTYLRQLMGIAVKNDYGFTTEGKQYSLTALKENIGLLDLDTIEKVNALVLEVGYDYLKKKDKEAIRLKADSYVVKTNVHFPTDYNLLWDAARKCIEISCQLAEKQGLPGWRKASDWKKRVKCTFRKVQKVKKSGGKNKESRLGFAVGSYLELATTLTKKICEFKSIAKAPCSISEINLQISLDYFHHMLDKHINLVDRRLLQGQKIPHSEKVFSLFEPHTGWINKGKAGVVAELGQKHLIVTDQNHFIVHHQLMGSNPDMEMTITLTKKLKKQYGNNLSSISLDKGFSSNAIIEAVKPMHPNMIIKAKGKPSKARLEIEQSDEFRYLQNKHQAIESNINQLTHNGLDICRDKGEENFKKYVSLAVVSYNLHRLGNLIKKQLNANSKKKARKAA